MDNKKGKQKIHYTKVYYKYFLICLLLIILIIILFFSFAPIKNNLLGFLIKEQPNETIPIDNQSNLNNTQEITKILNIPIKNNSDTIENKTEPQIVIKGNIGDSKGGGGRNCIPSKTCIDYLGQCGTGFSNGCENILDCTNNCNDGINCTEDICNSKTCQNIANDSNCEIGYYCDEILDCILAPACSVDEDCSYLNTVCSYGICNATKQCERNYNHTSDICRYEKNQCDIVEYCTGFLPECPSDINKSDYELCDDGNLCTENDFCIKGKCQSGTLKDCTLFDNYCNIGVCNSSGDCESTPSNEGGYCEEEQEIGTCSSGTCIITCYNDSGCSEEGNFCEGETPYSCILKNNGCLERINKTICSSNLICSNGECLLGINSCTEINSPGTYILNSNIINNSLSESCIKISSPNIILDCNNNIIQSSNSVSGIFSNQANTTIRNCNISMGLNFGGFGIEIINSSNNLIENNTLTEQYSGIYFHSNVSNSIIKNNNISRNDNRGIHLSLTTNISIENNIIDSNLFYGLILTKASKSLIKNNVFKDNWAYGILIEYSSDNISNGHNKILNNNISLSDTNIYIKTSNNIIKFNLINNSFFYHNLYIYNASNNSIENNTIIFGSQHGIKLKNAYNTTIKNNIVTNNQNNGLDISGTSSINKIENNQFCSNLIDIECETDQIFSGNYCNSGDVCGGICIPCSSFSGLSITGNVINIAGKSKFFKFLKNFFRF